MKIQTTLLLACVAFQANAQSHMSVEAVTTGVTNVASTALEPVPSTFKTAIKTLSPRGATKTSDAAAAARM